MNSGKSSLEFKRNNFDLIRLLAAMEVLIYHGFHHFDIHNSGWILKAISLFPGVPIFFLVSGFLISASYERSNSIFSYIENRFLRVYPALWISFLFSLITVFLFYDPQFSAKEFGIWTLAQVSIGQFYNPEFLRGYGVGTLNGSLWTIPVELQFYMSLPIIYLLLNRISWNKIFIGLLIVLLIAISQSYYLYFKGGESLLVKLFGVTLFPHLYMFMIGVVYQRNFKFISVIVHNRFHYFLAIYILSIPLVNYMGWSYQGSNMNPVSVVLLSLTVISFAYSNVDRLGNILRGYDISYGVYIYHAIFINAILHVSQLSPVSNMLIMLILTVCTALTSWVFIEKPSLKMKRYSINRKH